MAQKVEFARRVVIFSLAVSAVGNLGLVRMQFQLARVHSLLQRLPEFERLRLARTMADHIISVALERHAGIVLAHPAVKCIVQEEIGQ